MGDRVRGAPNLIIEVLSPNPRIGRTEEHVRWFAQYGVRECWLVHQNHRSVTVISFENRHESHRIVFKHDEPIESAVLPEFVSRLDDILE